MIGEISRALGGVPYGAVYALLGFAAVVVALQVWALVDLVRRDRVLWDRKWVWALLILFLSNGIGVVLYFVLGRRVPEPVEEATHAGDEDSVARTRAAVDVLYGGEEE